MPEGYTDMGTRFHQAYRAQLTSWAGGNIRRPALRESSLRDRLGLRLIALGERVMGHRTDQRLPLDKVA